MKLSKHRIFISGGAGVIGQELVKILYNEGAKLFIGDLKKKPKSFKDDIVYRQGDLNYIKDEELIEFNPNIFIHLAAINGTKNFYERPIEVMDVGVLGVINIFKYCDQMSIPKVVVASSAEVYQKPKILPTPEDENHWAQEGEWQAGWGRESQQAQVHELWSIDRCILGL